MEKRVQLPLARNHRHKRRCKKYVSQVRIVEEAVRMLLEQMRRPKISTKFKASLLHKVSFPAYILITLCRVEELAHWTRILPNFEKEPPEEVKGDRSQL